MKSEKKKIEEKKGEKQKNKNSNSYRCGKKYGKCQDGYCCSKYGWCGKSDSYCNINNGCQSEFGKCSSQKNTLEDDIDSENDS